MKKLTLLFAVPLALASAPHAEADIFSGVTTDNNIVTFDSTSPNIFLTSNPVTGLASGGGNLTNLTYNPADGLYYGLDFAANLYSITGDGAATQIPTTFAPAGFGALAYDPVGGNLVYVSEFAELFSITTSGAVTRLADFTYQAGDPNESQVPAVTAAGFDPDFGTPYLIDYQLDTLVTNLDVNLGSLSTVGPLGLDITSNSALVVDSLGNLFAALSADGSSSGFYSIDPFTGTASSLGSLTVALSAISGSGPGTVPLPEPSSAVLGLTVLGAALRRRRA